MNAEVGSNNGNGIKANVDRCLLDVRDLSARVTSMEIKQAKIEEKIDVLPEIKNQIRDLQTRVNIWSGAIAVLAFVTPFLWQYLFK